jgi:hypothetical protein
MAEDGLPSLTSQGRDHEVSSKAKGPLSATPAHQGWINSNKGALRLSSHAEIQHWLEEAKQVWHSMYNHNTNKKKTLKDFP